MLHRMGPRDGRATAARGLRRGHRFGLVGSTDHHSGYPGSYGYGRIAAAASALTREALWDAFLSRRVYAATGDRIALDFEVNGVPMGAELPPAARRHIAIRVQGRGALDSVELLKNERVLRRWTGPDPNAAGGGPHGEARPVRALVRLEWGWGPEPCIWEGSLTLDDGRVLSVEPCFAGPAVVAPQEDHDEPDDLPHEVLSQDARACAWRSRTEPNPTVRHSATQGLIVEVDMPPRAVLWLEVNGRRYAHTLAELLEASASHFLRGWRSEAIVMHRALPLDLCVLDVALDDLPTTDPPSGQGDADWYRVRVAQRNGQWAWSSPVWVARG
jgi:hypothetical protein